jgi:hypothetical protein
MTSVHNHSDSSKAEVLAEALLNVQTNLQLTQKDLSEIIHTSTATISRLKTKGSGIAPESAEGQFAVNFIRIYRSLSALLGGDDQQCREWINNYNDHLDSTPLDLLKNNMQDFQKVLIYLDAMRGIT